MTFVNEYISEEDKIKYGLDAIDKKFIVGGTKARSWTIDRECEIYLRKVANGFGQDVAHQTTWTFYWNDELIVLELNNISTSGKAGGNRHGHKQLQKIEIPDHLEDQRERIIFDFKKALTAYKDGGIFATAESYTLTLNILG